MDRLHPRAQFFFQEILKREALVFSRTTTKAGKNTPVGTIKAFDLAWLNGVIRAAVDQLRVEKQEQDRYGDRYPTTYSFRYDYIASVIKRFMKEDGSVNMQSVKKFTMHLDEKTLESAYRRLGVC